jgi:folate-binding protein YgfZ
MPILNPAGCGEEDLARVVPRGDPPNVSPDDPEEEFRAAGRGMAMTDNSLFGRIEVTGDDRLDLLHRLSTNSLIGLPAGGVASTVFVTDKGRVLDSVIVSAREDSLMLITSPGAELLLTRWIEKYTITEDIRLRTVTDDTVMISLLGPRIISMISAMSGLPSGGNGSVTLARGETQLFIVHTQDDRSDIANIIADKAATPHLMDMLNSLPGAWWIGRRAYEGVRIASGIPGFPGEINEAYTPFECGLRGSISFTKGCYIGQEVIARLDTYRKVRRHLARVVSGAGLSGPLPLPMLMNGAEAGTLTSMTEIPFGGKYLGLAIIRNDLAPGETLWAGTTGMSVLVTGTSSYT